MTNRKAISCHAAVTNTDSSDAAISTSRSRVYIGLRPIRSVIGPKIRPPKNMPTSAATPTSAAVVAFRCHWAVMPVRAIPTMPSR
jgi:hypothetical protein